MHQDYRCQFLLHCTKTIGALSFPIGPVQNPSSAQFSPAIALSTAIFLHTCTHTAMSNLDLNVAVDEEGGQRSRKMELAMRNTFMLSILSISTSTKMELTMKITTLPRMDKASLLRMNKSTLPIILIWTCKEKKTITMMNQVFPLLKLHIGNQMFYC